MHEQKASEYGKTMEDLYNDLQGSEKRNGDLKSEVEKLKKGNGNPSLRESGHDNPKPDFVFLRRETILSRFCDRADQDKNYWACCVPIADVRRASELKNAGWFVCDEPTYKKFK